MIIVAGLVVLTALAVWRLSQGPVPLDILRPYVERGMTTEDGSIRLVARHVTLNWAGWDRTLEVHVQTIEAVNTDGQVLATVPDAAVKLSLISLLTGELAPTSVQLEKLRLHIVVDESGNLNFGTDRTDDNANAPGQIVALLFEQLLKGGGDSPIRKLDRVTIAGAEIVFENKQRKFVWRAPNADIALYRNVEGVSAEAALDLDVGGRRAALNVRALYTRNRDRISVAINFESLRLATFAQIDQSLSRLADIDVPFSGVIDAVLSGQGNLRSVTVNVRGGAGVLNVADLMGQVQPVQSIAVRGEADFANHTVKLEQAQIVFGATNVSAAGAGKFTESGIDMIADLAINEFPGSELAKYWPPGLAPGGRRWALANVSHGMARDIKLKMAVKGPIDGSGVPTMDLVSGGMAFSGATVMYLPPMPPAENVGGTAVFEPTKVVFRVTDGKVGDIILDSADITLANLGTDNERAIIDASATGPFASIAKLLSHPRVGLPPNSVIPPARAGGQIASRVLLQFPLLDNITMKQLEFSASATTRALSIKDVVPGIDLTDGAVTVQLNGQEMDVRGKAKIAGLNSDVSWHENFGRTAGFRRRYQIKTSADAADFARLGATLTPYVSGPIGMTAIFQDNLAGGGTFDASLDLKQAALAMPELNWSKPVGKDAGARVSFEMRQGKWPSELDVQLATGDLDVKGKVSLASGLQRIAFDRLVSGRNDLSGTIARVDNGYIVTLKGNSLDAAPFLADDKPSSGNAPPPVVKPPSGPILDLSLDLRRVLTKRGEINNVAGKLRLQGGRLISASISARAPPDATVQIDIGPAPEGRNLSMSANDMGAILKSLGWLEGMFGGRAQLAGVFDDTKPGSPLRGRLVIDSYKLQKTPVVGDVLTVGELTDALSAFAGSGLEFNQLIAPFTWENGVLTLRGARTAGSSLGITASGRINTKNDTVQMAGSIVPAYLINSLIGNIPLLGPLITGGQGNGLFAINYAVEGPVSKPRVSTNPLSAIAPGFLRGLFVAGSSEDETLETNQQPRPPNEPGKP